MKERLAALLVIGLGLWLACQQPDLSWFNTHMARDYTRAQEWRAGQPSSWGGAEMNYNGGQLFGPAFYLGLACLARDLPTLLWQQHLLGLIPLLGLVLVVRKDLGRAAGWFFLLACFLMPVHVSLARTLWNPGWILPVNCCLFLCARLVWSRPRCWPLYFVLGWLGIQLHLSTLAAFLSGWAVLFRRQPKRLAAGLGLLLIYMAGFKWLEGAAYWESVRGQYHWPDQNPLQYLGRWLFHLHLSARPIFDYELFPVIFRYGQRLFADEFKLLRHFQDIGPLWLGVAALALLWPGRPPESQSRRFYVQFLKIWIPSVLFVMYFYTAKQGVIPYRYGLMLYPAQFLLPALALSRPLPRWLSLALLGCGGLLFLGDGFYLYQSYRVMSAAGRASHVAQDVYEIPLRHKIQLLCLSDDPYRTLHGPILNKIRMNEYNWGHTERYEAIRSTLKASPAGPHLAVFSLPLEQMRPGLFPFRLVPVEVPAVRYRFDSRPWRQLAAGATLMPLEKGAGRRLEVEALFGAAGFARICYDDSPAFPTFQLDQLNWAGQEQPFERDCPGWLAQSVVTLPIARAGRLGLRFRVLRPENRWSRIDLFKTPEAGRFSPL